MDQHLPRVKKKEHVNKIPFHGVLTRLDTASDRAPSGSRGHRVILTTAAAEEALPTLLGMAVGVTKDYDGHDNRQRCGVITHAWIEGDAVWVKGHIFGRDFPDVILAMQRQDKPLGMSYELADAHVADLRASVWVITSATFTGAAILRSDKAAYRSTRVNLTATAEIFTGKLQVENAGHVRLIGNIGGKRCRR